jgi:hypothetical protein
VAEMNDGLTYREAFTPGGFTRHWIIPPSYQVRSRCR